MNDKASINPIIALKNRLMGMTTEQQAKFYRETGVNLSNINLMDFTSAVRICKNLNLGDVSLWLGKSTKDMFMNSYMERLDRHNEESEKLIARYKALEIVMNEANSKKKKMQSELFSKYNVGNAAMFKELKKEGKVSSSDIYDYSKLQMSADEAALEYDIALSIANEHTHKLV